MKKYLLLLLLILMIAPAVSRAQGCAVCTKTASEQAPKAAKGMNSGILYLAFLPMTILGTVGYFWWRGSR